jgi:hypothetical protein
MVSVPFSRSSLLKVRKVLGVLADVFRNFRDPTGLQNFRRPTSQPPFKKRFPARLISRAPQLPAGESAPAALRHVVASLHALAVKGLDSN